MIKEYDKDGYPNFSCCSHCINKVGENCAIPMNARYNKKKEQKHCYFYVFSQVKSDDIRDQMLNDLKKLFRVFKRSI